LVEDVAWNLAQQSETFDNAAWTKNANVSITANNTTAPNGTTTADYVTFSTSGVNTQLYQVITAQAIITQSLYIKYISGTGTGIRLSNGSSINYGLNLEFTNSGATLTGTAGTNVISYEIVNSGNNWFRVSLTYSFTNPEFNLYRYTGTGSDVYAIWGAQLNIGSTAKPYFPTTDRLNVPRLTYQNGGGGCPSLLLEKQSTNLVLQSEAFNSANWLPFTTGSGTVNVIANAAISPDGTQNADEIQLTRSALTEQALLYQQQNASNATYSRTIYLKAARSQDVGKKVDVWSYDGLVLNPISATLTADWQRFDAGTSTGALIEILSFGYLTSSVYPTTSGTDVRFYAWGAQGEASSYSTSYIPTTSSSATRVADACSKTGISSLIGQTEGVLFCDFELKAYDSQAKWIAFLGGGSYYIGLYTDGNSRFVAEVYDNSASFVSQTFTFSVGTRYKLALAYKTNDFAFYVNGTQVATDNSGTVPATSQFSFEYNSTANNLTSRIYNQAIIFPTRLTNAELASLTT
jgi:hypothetical protein